MTEIFNRLEAALGVALLHLEHFAQSGDFSVGALTPAFGDELDVEVIETLAAAFASNDFSTLPQIGVTDDLDEAGVLAAYVAPPRDEGDTVSEIAANPGIIHVSRAYAETASTEALAKTILEEFGHALDRMLNVIDAPGDEGAIFANLVWGAPMSDTQLAALQAEDDHVELVIDGETVEAEASETFVVTTLEDQLDDLDGTGMVSLANFGGAGDLSLREAIALANADEATADRIEFDASLAGGTVELTRGFGQLHLTSDMTIDGDIDGDDAFDIAVKGAAPTSRIFLVYNSFGTFIAPDAEDTININGLYFNNGMHDKGGAIQSSATMTVSNSLFANNWTLLNGQDGGGAIWSDGDLTIHNSDFLYNGDGLVNRMVGNYWGGSGGAIRSEGGSLEIRDSYFDTNSAWNGGAIMTNSPTEIYNSTFNHNVASLGGAMRVVGNTPVLLDGVTMTGNVAFEEGAAYMGGSPLLGATSDLTVSNSTITGNHFRLMKDYDVAQGWLYDWQAIFTTAHTIAAGHLTLENSIVLGNSTSVVFNTQTSQTLDLVGGNIVQGGFTSVLGELTVDGQTVLSDVSYFDVFKNGNLQDNGGPVPTIALKPSVFNPALDAGDDAPASATDSRGEARVDQPDIGFNGDNTSDLGAFELQTVLDGSGVETPSLVVNTATDSFDAYDGLTSLREALNYVSSGLAGDDPTITFDGSVFDGEAEDAIVLTRGNLYVSQAVTIDAMADKGNGARVLITGDVDGDDLDADGLTLAQGGSGITDLALSQAAGTLGDNDWGVLQIVTQETVELNGLILTGGRALNGNNGGAINAISPVAEASTLLVRNSIISGNQSVGGYGGGIAGEHMTLENTVVSGNSVTGFFGAYGGGLYARGTATLVNSVVTNNYNAGEYGGGIGAGSVNLTNSIVTGNKVGIGAANQIYTFPGTTTLSGGNILGDTFSIDGVAQTTGLTAADVFAETDTNSTAGGGQLVLQGGNPVMALNDATTNPAIDGGDDALALATDALGADRTDWPDVAPNGANISDLGAYELRLVQPPVAVNDTASGDEDTTISGDVSTNDSEPDGGDLWYRLDTGPSKGTVVMNSDGTFDYTPNANYNGADSFIYAVTDWIDGWATATVTVTVAPVNDAPTVRDHALSISEDIGLSDFDPTLFARDVDGDEITLISVATAAHGTASINEDGNFDYIVDADYVGEDSVTYTVSDGNGGTATGVISLTTRNINDAPVPVADAFSGDEDTVISGDVSLNDTDVDGDTLTYTLAIPAAHGSVTVNKDGTFDYTPDENFFGSDSFSYAVSDGNGGSSQSSVTLTVNSVNDAPVAGDILLSMPEDDGALGYLHRSVTDVETVLEDGTWSFELGTAAANGKAVVNAGGSFYYDPDPDFFGTDSFTYIVYDGQGGSAEATVTVEVTPINDAPVVTITLDGPIAENVAGATLGTVTITDVDSTEFLIYASDQNFFGTNTRLEVVESEGTYILKLKDGMSFDYETDGATLRASVDVFDDLVYTPTREGGVDVVDLTILDVNDVAPSDITLSNLTVTENDVGATVGTLDAVDADGPSLTLTVSDDRFEVVGDALKLKDGVSLDRETEPSVSVTVTASDGTFSDTQDFTITVENVDEGAPANLALSAATIDENATGVLGTLSATDVDGDAITFSVSDSRFSVSGTTLSLVSALDHEALTGGQVLLEVTATAAGVATVETFTIDVADLNEAPELTMNFGDVTGLTESYPDIPTAEGVLHATLAVSGDSATYPISFATSDEDGDLVTITLTGADAAAFTVDPTTGALLFVETPDFEAPADVGGDGTYEVTVSASDGVLSSNSISLGLILQDLADAPVARDDRVTTQMDTTLTIDTADLLANDSDDDLGDLISFTAVSSPPAIGAIRLEGDGTLSYVPLAGWFGTDQFSYEIADEAGETATATVSVEVAGPTGLTAGPITYDEAGTWTWDTWFDIFDTVGDRVGRKMIYDDGRIHETTYEGGIRSLITKSDPENAVSWESIEQRYDAAGTITGKTAVYDDGRIYETTYEGGIRNLITKTDPENAVSWESIEQRYDAAGKITGKTAVYDDGRIYETTYEGGIRNLITKTDPENAVSWESVEQRYDAAGKITGKTAVYDDGRIYETTYEGGVQSALSVSDTADVFVWSEIIKTYDTVGEIDMTNTFYDDGREFGIDYTNGIRSSGLMTDTADAYEWATREFAYDTDGSLLNMIETPDPIDFL